MKKSEPAVIAIMVVLVIVFASVYAYNKIAPPEPEPSDSDYACETDADCVVNTCTGVCFATGSDKLRMGSACTVYADIPCTCSGEICRVDCDNIPEGTSIPPGCW